MRISLLLRSFLERSGYCQDGIMTGYTALAAACRLGDTAGQAYAHTHLGTVYTSLGTYPEAGAHLQSALDLYRQIGDPRGQAIAHNGLQHLSERQQRHADALRHAQQALEQYRIGGYSEVEAGALNNLAWSHIMLGHAEQALPFLRQALALQHTAGHGPKFAAAAWDSLGYAYHLLGRYRQAITCYRRAGSIILMLADRPNQAQILTHLGDAHRAADQLPEARRAWEQALDIFTDLNHSDAHEVRGKLASLSAETSGFPPGEGRAYEASDRAEGSGHDAGARRQSAGRPG
jgi:tetratricopeptide (TPR) repeat protein